MVATLSGSGAKPSRCERRTRQALARTHRRAIHPIDDYVRDGRPAFLEHRLVQDAVLQRGEILGCDRPQLGSQGSASRRPEARRSTASPQASARVLTGGGSDAINGRSADGGALGAAALDTSSQELLI